MKFALFLSYKYSIIKSQSSDKGFGEARTSVIYKIQIKSAARKSLDRAPQHIRKKIEEELKKVTIFPRSNKKLSGFEDRYRIRAGDWRAIYDDEITVVVIKVATRGDAYKA